MDQNMGGGAQGQGNDDPTRAREHVHAAEENRDALAAQNRRTEATTPDSVNTPVEGMNASGSQGGTGTSGSQGGTGTSGSQGGGSGAMGTGGQTASDDPSAAREHVRAAEENRDALAEESRRIQDSAPSDVDTGR